MLRRTLLQLSQNRWMRQWIEHSPLSRKLTSRFVAGNALTDGIQVLQKLANERIAGTLDFLGENVHSLTEAARSRDCYLAALDSIEAARLPATVSMKLTQFGLDFSEDACCENVVAVARRAQQMGSRVEVDMESSDYTDRTLKLVHCIQQQFKGHVRAVIQAYLYRSESDIRALSEKEIPVRLCKGAYREAADKAFPCKSEVDANYVKLMKQLLNGGAHPAIASHDQSIIRGAFRYIKEQNVAPERFEF